jgi:hypothetical protein
MGVWKGVAMDSLKFHPGLPCPTLLCPVSGVARLQVRWLAAFFYPLGHTTPYAYGIFVIFCLITKQSESIDQWLGSTIPQRPQGPIWHGRTTGGRRVDQGLENRLERR